MRLVHRLEPLFWGLFGAGGFAAALLLPGLVFGLTLAGPLGWFGDYAVDYHRMHALASNPLGRLVVLAVASLVFWHSAHHVRHLLLDLGLRRARGVQSLVLYGAALAGTIAALVVVGSV